MDPLSIAASTSALLAITNGVVGWGVSAFKAKEERLELYNRVQGVEPILNLILKRQNDAAKYPDERWWDGLEALSPNSDPPGPLCRLDSLVREAATELRPSTGVRQLMHSALHFWTKETYRAKIADISNYCAHIGLIVQNAHVDISLSNNRQGKQTYARVGEVQVTIESLADEVKLLKLDAYRQREERCQAECREIAYWLSPLNRLKRQDFLKAQTRVSFMTLGFPELEELLQWANGKPRRSRCYGYGGAGKTTAASVVADHLQKKPDPGSSQTLCIYFDYKDKQNLTLPILLGSLIRQLLLRDISRTVPDGVRDIYASWRWRDSRPDETILLDIFMESVKVYRRCWLFLDAVEERPKQGYNGIVASLLGDSRTDVNAQYLSRWTALAHTVKEYAIVTDKNAKYKCGVDKLARNEHGKTALELANAVGHGEIIGLLRSSKSFASRVDSVQTQRSEQGTPPVDAVIDGGMRVFPAFPMPPQGLEEREATFVPA
ncbi:hypothetical protein LTR50_003891 [Elasticomyces elasticus]|nr:hypothetical protein LTR50_003891 [Elasticomyces elasticus]